MDTQGIDFKDWLWFWSKVEKGPTCWVWIGSTNGKYGHFRRKERDGLAHRLAYEMCVGKIPEDLTIDHECNFGLCVNPSHLRVMTNRENNARNREVNCACGHLLSGRNLYVWKTGARYCRACHARWEAERRHRLKANGQCINCSGTMDRIGVLCIGCCLRRRG